MRRHVFTAALLLTAGTRTLHAQDTIPPRPEPAVRDSAARDSVPASVPADSARRDSTGTRTAPRPRRPAARPEPRWPVDMPPARPGSLLPGRRIVAYYGNPMSRRMGILGEVAPDEMLRRLDREVQAWNAADSTTPVQPALHLIAVVAQAGPGADGKYRLRMPDTLIARVAGWARSRGAILFLDIQLGRATLREELPRLERWLRQPDVHLGIDPEFSMHHAAAGHLPGKRIGVLDAADINYAMQWLGGIVDRDSLPPKVLVIHRFRRDMVRNSDGIRLDPRVQVVMHMDGWGSPEEKVASYREFIWRYPVQYTGFKLFYRNDTKRGHPLMSPRDILRLNPKPVYIQYQ